MRTMKWLVVAVALVGGCVSDDLGSAQQQATGSGSASTVVHWTWNGGALDTMSFDPMTGTGLMLFASKKDATQAQLYFDLQQVDFSMPWMVSSLRGYGLVPADAIAIGNGNGSVHATVQASPTFYMERCSYDFYSYCMPVSETVAVDFTWTGNGYFSSFHSGIDQVKIAGGMSKTQGSYRQTSADVNGTLGTATFSNGFGYINDARGTTVMRDMDMGPPPPM